MEFKGLPKPQIDETLSSWVYRCSINQYILVRPYLNSDSRPKSIWVEFELKFNDADVDFEYVARSLEIQGVKASYEAIKKFFSFKEDRVVEWGFRNLFCGICLRQDIVSGRIPTWRKSWCYEYSSMCIVHGVQLDVLLDPYKYSKAWDAFVQTCTVSCRAPSSTSSFSRVSASIFINIIEYLDRRASKEEQDLFNKLFHILLQGPFKGYQGGAARINFSNTRGVSSENSSSLLKSFTDGVFVASPSTRIGAMALAGALMEIIPESKFTMFIDSYESVYVGCIILRDLHRTASFPLLDKEGYGVLFDYLGVVHRPRYPVLDRHLKIQEQRYKLDGAFDGRLLGSFGDED